MVITEKCKVLRGWFFIFNETFVLLLAAESCAVPRTLPVQAKLIGNKFAGKSGWHGSGGGGGGGPPTSRVAAANNISSGVIERTVYTAIAAYYLYRIVAAARARWYTGARIVVTRADGSARINQCVFPYAAGWGGCRGPGENPCQRISACVVMRAGGS